MRQRVESVTNCPPVLIYTCCTLAAHTHTHTKKKKTHTHTHFHAPRSPSQIQTHKPSRFIGLQALPTEEHWGEIPALRAAKGASEDPHRRTLLPRRRHRRAPGAPVTTKLSREAPLHPRDSHPERPHRDSRQRSQNPVTRREEASEACLTDLRVTTRDAGGQG